MKHLTICLLFTAFFLPQLAYSHSSNCPKFSSEQHIYYDSFCSHFDYQGAHQMALLRLETLNTIYEPQIRMRIVSNTYIQELGLYCINVQFYYCSKIKGSSSEFNLAENANQAFLDDLEKQGWILSKPNQIEDGFIVVDVSSQAGSSYQIKLSDEGELLDIFENY